MDNTPTYIPASVLGGLSAPKLAPDQAPDEAPPFSPRLQRLGISAMVTIIATALWTAIIPDKPAPQAQPRALSAARAPAAEQAAGSAGVASSDRPPDMVFTLDDDVSGALEARPKSARAKRSSVPATAGQRSERLLKRGRIKPNPY